jgi:hypothetical protein
MVLFKRWITSLVVQAPVYGFNPLVVLVGEAKEMGLAGTAFLALRAVRKSLLSIAVFLVTMIVNG